MPNPRSFSLRKLINLQQLYLSALEKPYINKQVVLIGSTANTKTSIANPT